MTSFPTAASRRARLPRSQATFSLALAAAALAVVGVGVALPWVTVFRGLAPVPGFTLEGGPLSGLALAAAGLLGIALRVGGGRVLRPAAALMSLFVALDALLVSTRIAQFVADPGPAAALTRPTSGIGALVTAFGAGLLALAAVATPAIPHGLGRRWAWVALAVSLFVAGWIHLLLVPAHLEEDRLLGAGFLLAGLVQVGLAAAAAFRPSSRAAFVVIAVDATLIAVYAYAVIVGLPFARGHDEIGLVVGAGEPIDLAGAVSKCAELAGIVLAFLLLPAPDGARIREGGGSRAG